MCDRQVLSDVCLFRIFWFLDLASLCRVAQVCVRFRGAVQDPQCWQWLDLSPWPGVDDDMVAPLIRSNAVTTIVLIPQSSTSITDATLRLIGARCPRLKRLTVQNSRLVTDDGVKSVCTGTKSLVAVSFKNCRGIGDAGTFLCFLSVLVCCTSIPGRSSMLMALTAPTPAQVCLL